MWAIANLRGKLLLYSRKFRGRVGVWTKVVTFYLQFFTVTKTKVCKEESRRAFEAKTRNQCYWWSYEKGAGESKHTVILRKIRVSDKGDSLIKHRREQTSSHSLTGPHNSISRIRRKKKKNPPQFLVFGSTDGMPLLVQDRARMTALIWADLGTCAQFCFIFGQHFFIRK